MGESELDDFQNTSQLSNSLMDDTFNGGEKKRDMEEDNFEDYQEQSMSASMMSEKNEGQGN